MSKKVLILAGGLGKRMGGYNKGDLLYNSKSFLDIIIEKLDNFNEIVISLNKTQTIYKQNIKVVYDSVSNIGPMGGLFEGLKFIKKNSLDTQLVLVLPCDSPNIQKEFIDYLYEFNSTDYDAIIIKGSDGRIHPLIGLYNVKILGEIEKLIKENDYKIFSLLDKINVKYVSLKYTKFTDDILKNINTPEDYNSLKIKSKPIIAISGIKNSGKTTLIVKLIKKFKEKGIKVGTLKHDGHDFNMDNLDSDTDKYLKAGASQTLIFSKNKFMYLEKTKKINVKEYLKYFNRCDLILLEGFKESEYPKIEIVRKKISKEGISNKKGLLFYVTDVNEILEDKTIDSVDLDNLHGIFNMLFNYLKEKRCLI